MDNPKVYLAGTLESSDIMISLEPCKGIDIQLTSTVIHQFGEQIRKVIADTLSELGVNNARILANDRGALDCTVAARLRTAIERARADQQDWGV